MIERLACIEAFHRGQLEFLPLAVCVDVHEFEQKGDGQVAHTVNEHQACLFWIRDHGYDLPVVRPCGQVAVGPGGDDQAEQKFQRIRVEQHNEEQDCVQHDGGH